MNFQTEFSHLYLEFDSNSDDRGTMRSIERDIFLERENLSNLEVVRTTKSFWLRVEYSMSVSIIWVLVNKLK